MNVESEIIENKAKIKLNEHKIDILINILCREGVISKDELEEELSKLIKE